MHFCFAPFSARLAKLAPLRAFPLCFVLFVLAWAIFVWASPGNATAASTSLAAHDDSATDAIPFEQPLYDTELGDTERAFESYFVQMEGEPVAALYAGLVASAQNSTQDEAGQGEDVAQSAALRAATQTHLATVDQAQLALVATLAAHDAQVLYRVQRVLNGVAVYAPTDQVAALVALPGVTGVYPLIPKEPHNARADALLNAPDIWEGINAAGINTTGLTGQGISIAIIDTGIDYLHTAFGGPGNGYEENDTALVSDADNFPGAKVVGGYDFTGDTYDANPTSVNFQPVPVPDADPMDCYGFGHGTHVAGTAAGYGVRADGSTYPGPFDSTIDLDTLRIGPGLAPEAAIYALKVFGCTGSSNVVDVAIEWAVDPNQDGDFSDHVDVINMSLGSNFGADFDATTVAVENAAKLGIVVVTSAGNTGDVHYAVGSPGVASNAIAVGATSISSLDPTSFEDGTVASFSARGPRRGDHVMKPDLAAPGMNVVSARRATGTQSVTSSGTSMASPVVAGIMALLRQAHPAYGTPGWRVQELKALAMNTAVYPLLRPDIAGSYSLLRVGAGRIDPVMALQSRLIAYDAAAPELVSVSFGLVETLDTTTVVRAIRLANKSNAPIVVTVGYTAVSDLPGVSIDVGVGKAITVPALGFATTPVTLTVDATALMRRVDPARQLVPPGAHPWVDEASGYVSFTPIDDQVVEPGGPPIHVPIHAVPRAVSAFTALSDPIGLGDSVTASFPLTIAGNAFTSVITNAVAPTQSVPMLGVFGLAHSSPPIRAVPNGDELLGRYAHADLRYVGIAGPVIVEGEPMLYFALVAYGAWSTPLEVTYQIAIDVNDDDFVDFRLQNRESTDLSNFDFATTDEFVSMLERVGGSRVVQGPLNLYTASEFDTRPFANNVMVLPLRLADLGEDVTLVRYQVTSMSRDVVEEDEVTYIETTPILSLRLERGAGLATAMGVPLFPVAAGDVVEVTFDRAAYIAQRTDALLLLFQHNEIDTRTQVVPVDFNWFFDQYLPSIGVD